MSRLQSRASGRGQGADSLEVVHGGLPPDKNASIKADGAGVVAKKRGGIHAFGKSYIPYTSRGNKEVNARR